MRWGNHPKSLEDGSSLHISWCLWKVWKPLFRPWFLRCCLLCDLCNGAFIGMMTSFDSQRCVEKCFISVRNIASGHEVPRPNSRLEIQKLGTRIKTSLAWNVYRCQTSSQVDLMNGPPLAATGCISPQGLRTAPRASQGTHFGRSRPSSHPMQRQSHQPDPIRLGCVGFQDMFSNARQHLYIYIYIDLLYIL